MAHVDSNNNTNTTNRHVNNKTAVTSLIHSEEDYVYECNAAYRNVKSKNSCGKSVDDNHEEDSKQQLLNGAEFHLNEPTSRGGGGASKTPRHLLLDNTNISYGLDLLSSDDGGQSTSFLPASNKFSKVLFFKTYIKSHLVGSDTSE